jgi:hypothetical protein
MVIDLGVVTDPPPNVPWRLRLPRARAAFPAILLACLLLSGSAAGHGRPMFDPPVRVPVQAGSDFRLAPDGLYVTGVHRTDLAAFSVRTGQRRWSVALPPIAGFNITPAGDLVLVLVPGSAMRTMALDARTGEVRWSRAGAAIWVSPRTDRAVIATDAVFTDTRATRPLMSVVDLRTGAELVTEPIHLRRSGELTVVVEIGPDGEQVAGIRIATPPDEPQWLDFASGQRHALPLADTTEGYLLAGDLLVGYGASEMRAYNRAGTRLRWVLPDAREAGSTMCGPWLCALMDDDLVAVDPASGTVRWRSPWQFIVGLRERTLAVRFAPEPVGMAVFDAGTGRVLRELPHWRPLPASGYRTRLPVLVPQRPGVFEVAVFDLDRLVAYPLGAFSGDTGPCQSVPGYVACPSRPEEITVWRYGG